MRLHVVLGSLGVMLAAPLVASPVNLAATGTPEDAVRQTAQEASAALSATAPEKSGPARARAGTPVKRTAAVAPGRALEGRTGEGRAGEGRANERVETPSARAAEPMLVSVDCVLDGCVVQSGLELTVVGSSGGDGGAEGPVGRRRATN